MLSRYQLEWSVITMAGVQDSGAEVRARSQLKRLWLADRKMPVESSLSEFPLRRNYAFFDGEMPGKGNAVSYSRHDAYLLCLAFSLLRLGWKPEHIIATCRVYRPALVKEYDRLIKAKAAFGVGGRDLPEDKLHKLKTGKFVHESRKLSWLVITANLQAGLRYERDDGTVDGGLRVANIVDSSTKLTKFCANLAATDGHAIVLEICNPALSMDYLLDIAPIVKRGRRPKASD